MAVVLWHSFEGPQSAPTMHFVYGEPEMARRVCPILELRGKRGPSSTRGPMKAVVVHELNRIAVEDVELAPPKSGEVKVRMVAAGVCHSDLSVVNGTIPHPLPIVLGHEGAGIVEAVGDGVSNCKPGDH